MLAPIDALFKPDGALDGELRGIDRYMYARARMQMSCFDSVVMSPVFSAKRSTE